MYNGKGYSLFANPLERYLSDNPAVPKFVPQCTMCWRGYVASWEINHDRLYLTGLGGTVCRKTFEGDAIISKRCGQRHWGECSVGRIDLYEIFPRSYAKVYADWFSGKLVIPQGEMVQYIHMGYASQYERYIKLSIERGVLVEARIDKPVINHRLNELMAILHSKDFER